jgi:hypothetical protein
MKRPRVKTIDEKIVQMYKELRGVDTKTAWLMLNFKFSTYEQASTLQ